MKRTLTVVSLGLLLAFVLGGPAAAEQFPISGSFQTTAWTPDQVNITVAGSGSVTYLGDTFTLIQEHTHDFVPPGPSGPPTAKLSTTFMAATAPSGESLVMEFHDAATIFTSQTSLTFSGTVRFVGGTGRFANASGTASFSGAFQFTSPTGGVGQYSFEGMIDAPVGGTRLTVPAVVETPAFSTELVVTNTGQWPAVLTLAYRESLSPALGAGGTAKLTVDAGQQLVLPEAVDALREKGVAVGARGKGAYAGALRVDVAGVHLDDIDVGARVVAKAPRGGGYGVYLPAVVVGREAGPRSAVYGLREDGAVRSNVALVNAGDAGAGPIELRVVVHDGLAGGKATGDPLSVWLEAGAWTQLDGILGARAVTSGWVTVERVSGTAPWIAYGVVNDGAHPGEGTGDGAYVPMTR